MASNEVASQPVILTDGNGGYLRPYTDVIPTASINKLGGVKIDNETIVINENGVISAVGSQASILRQLVDKKEPTEDDFTWFNLYSDRYCEQGGQFIANDKITIVELIKEYKNTLYMPNLICTTYLEGAIDGRTSAFDFTTKSFKVFDAGERSYRWSCTGYIKE